MRKLVAGITVLVLSVLAASADIIKVDFRNDATTIAGWNAAYISGPGYTGVAVADLLDSEGAATGIPLTIVNQFDNSGNGGMFGTIYGDVIGTRYAFSGSGGKEGIFTLSNLDPSTAYSFTFFGSRNGAGPRESIWQVTGSTGTISSSTLESAYNLSNTVSVNDVYPDALGVISVKTAIAPGSTYAYLNAMEVSYTTAAIPEASSVMLLGTGMFVLFLRRKLRI